MKIESGFPNFYNNIPQTVQRGFSAPAEPQNISYYAPGVVVEISQQARDAYNQSKVQASGEMQEIAAAKGLEGCQTCKNRRYVDESNDSSVSYQTPAHIAPEQAASKVMAHEREHVNNEQAKAQRDDRRVVSNTVSLSTSICPECGKVYVSGGVTRTVTADKKDSPQTEIKDSEVPQGKPENTTD